MLFTRILQVSGIKHFKNRNKKKMAVDRQVANRENESEISPAAPPAAAS